tara:strand:+ start:2878 stop:3216 length:339 start_codon:yes stop_codon:yes gene_type:complete
MNLFIGIALMFMGQVLGWFQLNTQYLSEWWKDKPFAAALALGIPCSMFFWYAWRFIVDQTGSVWTARFLGSSAGLIVFPILTWTLLGESMFTAKTMVCFSLAVLIILIQLFW